MKRKTKTTVTVIGDSIPAHTLARLERYGKVNVVVEYQGPNLPIISGNDMLFERVSGHFGARALLRRIEQGYTFISYPTASIWLRILDDIVYIYTETEKDAGILFSMRSVDFSVFYAVRREPGMANRLTKMQIELPQTAYLDSPEQMTTRQALTYLNWPDKSAGFGNVPPAVKKSEKFLVRSEGRFSAKAFLSLLEKETRLFNHMNKVVVRYWNRAFYIYLGDGSPTYRGLYAVVEEHSFLDYFRMLKPPSAKGRMLLAMESTAVGFFLKPTRMTLSQALERMNWNGRFPSQSVSVK